MARVLVAVAGSAVAHAVLVGAALALALPSGWGDRARLDPVEITVLANPEPREQTDDPIIAPERHTNALPAAERPRDRRHVPRHAANDQASTQHDEEPAPSIMVPEIPTEPAARERDPERDRRLAILLRPDNVARGADWMIPGQGPSQRGQPAGRNLDDGRPTEQELEASLGGGLRTEAMTKRHITRTRPEFRRQADGSHVYAGHLNTARIDRCGEITFQDRPAAETEGFSLSGSWDLQSLTQQAQGQNPNRAEEDWILEHSEELRNQLGDVCRREELATGRRRLRGRLTSTWSRTERTPQSRRRHIFDIWDEMEEGEAGDEFRAIVIQFVRENLPAGSEDAYTPEELERLNARRDTQGERFDPY